MVKHRTWARPLGYSASIVLMWAVAILPAEAQYEFLTKLSPDSAFTVYKGSPCPTGTLVIPESINGEKVTSIGERAFTDCHSLTNVIIPDGVISIGWGAFRGCTNLQQVYLQGAGRVR